MKFLVVSDFDVKKGSGYYTITSNLCDGLVEAGHEIVVLGMEYDGSEHSHPYSVVPTESGGGQKLKAHIERMLALMSPEVLLVVSDLTLQEFAAPTFGSDLKYVGIFAVEGEPIGSTSPWARAIRCMYKAFPISSFGERTIAKAGLQSFHLPIGVDSKYWRTLDQEIKWEDRQALGIGRDAFVVIMVAHGHERKHWPGAIEAFSKLCAKTDRECFFIAVTKKLPHWMSYDIFYLGDMFEVSDKMLVINGGVHQDRLLHLYNASDVFLLTSKAEGLGLPLLEAMSVGLPCVATDCTAVTETLTDGRGLLIPSAYHYLDAFGTTWRYFPDSEIASDLLLKLSQDSRLVEGIKTKADQYVKTLTWKRTLEVFLSHVEGRVLVEV